MGETETGMWLLPTRLSLRELVSLKIPTYISYGLGHKLQDLMSCPRQHICLKHPGHHLPLGVTFPHRPILQGKNRGLADAVSAAASLHTQEAALIFKKSHYLAMWKNR